MINLDNITLSDSADIEKVNENFQKIQPAVNNNESKITNLEATINNHTQQISNLQDNLANYIDAFDTKADLDAYSGALSNNDWAVVLDDETHSHQCWRYIYKESTSSWLPQFMINETPLTQTQLAALNSGIDSTKVAQIAQNTTDIANKQNKLTAGTGINIDNNDVISVSGGSSDLYCYQVRIATGETVITSNNLIIYFDIISSADVTIPTTFANRKALRDFLNSILVTKPMLNFSRKLPTYIEPKNYGSILNVDTDCYVDSDSGTNETEFHITWQYMNGSVYSVGEYYLYYKNDEESVSCSIQKYKL